MVCVHSLIIIIDVVDRVSSRAVQGLSLTESPIPTYASVILVIKKLFPNQQPIQQQFASNQELFHSSEYTLINMIFMLGNHVKIKAPSSSLMVDQNPFGPVSFIRKPRVFHINIKRLNLE